MDTKKEEEWAEEWDLVHSYYKDARFLFSEWIWPNKLEDFKGKTVLDVGCGSGEHISIVLPFVKHIIGVDLNPSLVLLKRFKDNSKVKIVEGDVAHIHLKKKFDIVYSIGVLHHTQNPSISFQNLLRHTKRGGELIVWVYSYEGNFLNRTLLEWIKKYFLLRLSRKHLLSLAKGITFLMYAPIYSIYLLPLKFLPFYEYFDNWRKLTFKMNVLNVFDKMNAPTTHFIKGEMVKNWFSAKDFKDVHISPYKGVSWRGSGTRK